MSESKELLAIVTTVADKEKVTGDIPIFIAESPEEKDRIASYLARALDAMVHDLDNGVYYIVRH